MAEVKSSGFWATLERIVAWGEARTIRRAGAFNLFFFGFILGATLVVFFP